MLLLTNNPSNWLMEWRLHRSMRRHESGSDFAPGEAASDAERSAAKGVAAPFDANPKPGQIRLLSPELSPPGFRLLYVAVLWKLKDSRYLAVPFSRFQTPAFQHEILLKKSPPCLSVLSVWNARKISAFALSQTWTADELSDSELQDARAAYRAFGEGASLPDALKCRVGPEIQDPLDPRYEYMDEEGEIWSRLFPVTGRLDQRSLIRFTVPDEKSGRIALAAASRTGYVPLFPLKSVKFDALIHPFADSRGEKLWLLISDGSGQPSLALEGSSLATRGAGIIGRIEESQALVESRFPIESVVMPPDGNPEPLQPASDFSIPRNSYLSALIPALVNPESVAALTDSELERLTAPLPRDNHVLAAVVGELYARAWLYGTSVIRAQAINRPEFDELRVVFEQTLLPARSGGETGCLRLPTVAWHPIAMAVWEHLIGRISSFLQADGFIPLVLPETGEAFPLAFSLLPYAAASSRIIDMNQVPIPVWDEANEIVRRLIAEGLVLQLHCSVEKTSRTLTGQSMEIPVLMGLARRRGWIPEYSPLAVMATGAAQGERIVSVAGLDAKQELARRMRVKLFIAPGADDGEDTMRIQPGTTINSFLEKLSGRLEQSGLADLDVRSAATRLQQLGDEIHEGRVRMSEAAARVARYEKIFTRDSSSKIAMEGLIRARVLRGAIANHSGSPDAGALATTDASRMALDARMPFLYVNAMANRIVSLTDLGDIDQAEKDARALLKWVKEEIPASAEEQMRAEMIASGVLGGQPLMIKALQDEALMSGAAHDKKGAALESLGYLEKAFELAGQLQLPHDICRDAVQIAQWHAFFRTDVSVNQCEKAQSVLNGYGPDISSVSNAYLARIRFLAAYRIHLMGSAARLELADWPLPDKSVGTGAWLYATALKYRGAILAARGELDRAMTDFTDAMPAIEIVSSPMLHFITGTIALQAGESLINREDVAKAFLARAREIFDDCHDWRCGRISAIDWQARVQGVVAGEQRARLPNPQLGFPY